MTDFKEKFALIRNYLDQAEEFYIKEIDSFASQIDSSDLDFVKKFEQINLFFANLSDQLHTPIGVIINQSESMIDELNKYRFYGTSYLSENDKKRNKAKLKKVELLNLNAYKL